MVPFEKNILNTNFYNVGNTPEFSNPFVGSFFAEIRKCSRFNFYSLYPLVNVKRSTSDRFIQAKTTIVTLKHHFLPLEQRQETMDPGVVDSIFSSSCWPFEKSKMMLKFYGYYAFREWNCFPFTSYDIFLCCLPLRGWNTVL